MGGASIFRGIYKLVGAAAIALSGSASIGPVYAKPSGVSLAVRLSSCTCSISGLSCNEPPGRHSVSDGWELAEEWTDCRCQKQHLIFGSAPTENEVDEATQELQAALKFFPTLFLSEDGRAVHAPASGEDGQQGISDWINPPHRSNCHMPLLPAEGNSVYQAFQLLQTNPHIQGAVKSLARDPAVWRAVLSNHKIKEFKRSLEGGADVLEAVKDNVGVHGRRFGLEFVTTICNRILCQAPEVMGKILEIVSSMFESIENMLFGKMNSDPVDNAVTSCMMLAVALLVVVLIKRAMA